MGERWAVGRCEKCGLLTERLDECPTCPGAKLTDIEVVPASALKRCEEERDQWKRGAEGDMNGLVTHEYHLHMVKALVAERQSAEAKCERLEAGIREALPRIETPRARSILHDAIEGIDPLLSTPKTEGEYHRIGISDAQGRDTGHDQGHASPDPIGRDVRGYEK